MQSRSEPPDSEGRSFVEQARRTQIVAAAGDVVAELGYSRTSLARIAERAGISKGVITYHFRSKDEILREVVTRFFDRGWTHMEPRIRAEETALGKIRAWAASELEFFAAHRTEFLAVSEIFANHREQDGSHAYAGEFREETDAVAEILEDGQRTGELRPFEPRSVATIIQRCTDAVLSTWAVDPTIDLATLSSELQDFIDHAIRREPT